MLISCFQFFPHIFSADLQNQFTKNEFVTLFSSDIYKIFKRSRLIPQASQDVQFVP